MANRKPTTRQSKEQRIQDALANGRLFTPYLGYGKIERVKLLLNSADHDKFNRLPKDGLRPEDYRETVTVKDLPTGREFVVRRAHCGSDCYCAAEIVTGNIESLQTFV